MTGAGSPLRIAAFRWFLAARLVAVVGNAVAPIAVAFAVLDLTGSAADLGLVLAARSVPLVVFLLFGGVVADRVPRHLVIVAASVVSFASQAVAATLLLTGYAQLWQIVAVEAVNGAAFAFTAPAMAGMVPQLVPRDVLQQASALGGFVRNGGAVLGAAFGGILVAALGSGWGVAVDAATFGLGALLLLRVRPPAESGRADGAGPAGSVLRDLRDGWREFASRTWLWVVVLGFSVVNAILAGGWNTLGPVIADDTIGRGPWGLVLSAQSVGLLVAMVVMLRLRFRHPLRVGLIGMCAVVPQLAVLAVYPTPGALAIGALAGGIGGGLFDVAWETALGTHVPLDRLSRVSAYDGLGSVVALPVGQVVGGWLGAEFAPRPLVLAGAVVLAVVLAAVLACRPVRDLPAGDGRLVG
ncbi:MAG TPA: MFS transporter [Actinocatenispora sp.]